jgi:hypothetical protein
MNTFNIIDLGSKSWVGSIELEAANSWSLGLITTLGNFEVPFFSP